MPRYVVLEHAHPRGRHWDFMLEMGGALATWTLTEPPDTSGPIPAEALPDHRLAYLDYEGPVSGDRGSVARWDQGTFEIERQSAAELVVSLHGKRLLGRAMLERSGDDAARWTFSYLTSTPGR